MELFLRTDRLQAVKPTLWRSVTSKLFFMYILITIMFSYFDILINIWLLSIFLKFFNILFWGFGLDLLDTVVTLWLYTDLQWLEPR